MVGSMATREQHDDRAGSTQPAEHRIGAIARRQRRQSDRGAEQDGRPAGLNAMCSISSRPTPAPASAKETAGPPAAAALRPARSIRRQRRRPRPAPVRPPHGPVAVEIAEGEPDREQDDQRHGDAPCRPRSRRARPAPRRSGARSRSRRPAKTAPSAMPARTMPGPDGSGGKPFERRSASPNMSKPKVPREGMADEHHRRRDAGGMQQRHAGAPIERDGDHGDDEGRAVEQGVAPGRSRDRRTAPPRSARRRSRARSTASRPALRLLPAAEPDEGQHGQRHRRDEQRRRQIGGQAVADIEQRPQRRRRTRPAPIRNFQSRSRAIEGVGDKHDRDDSRTAPRGWAPATRPAPA